MPGQGWAEGYRPSLVQPHTFDTVQLLFPLHMHSQPHTWRRNLQGTLVTGQSCGCLTRPPSGQSYKVLCHTFSRVGTRAYLCTGLGAQPAHFCSGGENSSLVEVASWCHAGPRGQPPAMYVVANVPRLVPHGGIWRGVAVTHPPPYMASQLFLGTTWGSPSHPLAISFPTSGVPLPSYRGPPKAGSRVPLLCPFCCVCRG